MTTFPFLLYNPVENKERGQYRVLSGNKHTYYRITYNHPNNLDEGILAVYDTVYKSLNPFNRQSTISKVNNNEEVILDPVFIEAFTRSMELAEKTKGTFDPTCSPLINLWGFGFECMDKPSDNLINGIKEYIGYDKISLENNSIKKKHARIQLNFSAMGDGFSCDIIARYLDSKGVDDYMVDIGGEIVTKGKNKSGFDWSVGIIKPPKYLGAEKSVEFEAVLRLNGKTAISTSGNYNNFRSQKGKQYGHTINPATGYPVSNNILSATVIASDCATADAYATAIMVTEAGELDKLLQTADIWEYYIIYIDKQDNYSIKQSKSIESYL